MYGDFAYFYDKLMYDLDYEKIYKFIGELLGKKSLEADLILEMACGTGGLTEKLVKDYKVHAFDLSEDMLAVCENKIRSRNLRLFKQNMAGSVSYTHLTLPTTLHECRSRWSPYH